MNDNEKVAEPSWRTRPPGSCGSSARGGREMVAIGEAVHPDVRRPAVSDPVTVARHLHF
jgi:hypothetical protein